mmetsp:Transcript_119181/g.309302  ORF Transcript_119181/g.309302 Transcript_119181/m.309302 type:complete len:176 (-) Transcript_119181:12-539(-)
MSLAVAAPPVYALASSVNHVVAVDIDEVLCKYCEGFIKWYTGRPVALDAGQCFRACYAPGVESARTAFLDTQAFANELDPIPGALESLLKLRGAGFELHAVTARPEACRVATEQYLAKFFPGLLSGLHFAQAPYKGRICRSICACALIDDQLANALDAGMHGVPAIVLDLDGTYT